MYKIYTHAHKNYNHVHRGIIQNSKKLKTTYISNNKEMDE